jgi:C-terminal processing protease CtpA/Prc
MAEPRPSTRILTTKKHVEFDSHITITPLQTLGFSFTKDKATGHLVITKIDETGVVAQQTKLAVGDIISAIQNVGCSATEVNGVRYEGISTAEAAKLLKASTHIHIRAIKPSSKSETTVWMADNHVKTIEVVITKEAKSSSAMSKSNSKSRYSLGFTIGKNGKGDLFVKKTHQGGLVTRQQTGLRPGYTLLTINGTPTTGMTVEEAGNLCKASQTVRIRAQKRIFAPQTFCKTTVTKLPATTPLGMTLAVDKHNGSMYVKAIQHDSLVYHTGFQPGFTLLAVNDYECQGKTVRQVQSYIASLPAGTVTLKAQTP